MEQNTLKEFCDMLSSNSPAPGGGSVSALAGALAASLSTMVAALTANKKNYEMVTADMENIIREGHVLRDKLLHDIARDSRSFEGFMEAMALPKTTPEQKKVRQDAMQTALKHAVAVPLDVAETCYKILPLAIFVVNYGNQNAITDGIVSGMMARTAVLGALSNVRINLSSIKDEQFVAETTAKVNMLWKGTLEQESAILDSAMKL